MVPGFGALPWTNLLAAVMNGVDKNRSQGVTGANHKIYRFLWADRLEVEEVH